MKTMVRKVVLAAGLGALLGEAAGCEMIVQIDRSVVDAGEAGCPICSDAGVPGDDAAEDAAAVDADADAEVREPVDSSGAPHEH